MSEIEKKRQEVAGLNIILSRINLDLADATWRKNEKQIKMFSFNMNRCKHAIHLLNDEIRELAKTEKKPVSWIGRLLDGLNNHRFSEMYRVEYSLRKDMYSIKARYLFFYWVDSEIYFSSIKDANKCCDELKKLHKMFW